MPSRPGQAQSTAANTTYGTQATTANTNAEADLAQASNDQTNLRSGKMVGADPYLNPQYLSAVSRLRAGALNQNTNAGDEKLRALNARTGGMNSTATTGAIGKLALDKARLGNQLGAEQTAGDWTKNIGYQLNLAQQPLQSAAEQAKLYSTATQGQGDALKDLTQFGLASYGPWMSGITAAGAAGAAALKPYAPGCWIAAAVFDGWDDPRTSLVRNWLHGEFARQPLGNFVVRVYLRFGERIAEMLDRFPLLKTPFRWLLNRALIKATRWAEANR